MGAVLGTHKMAAGTEAVTHKIVAGSELVSPSGSAAPAGPAPAPEQRGVGRAFPFQPLFKWT